MKHKFNIHYAWVILLLSFIGLLAVQGMRLSFGAFIQPWERSFSLNRSSVSLIATLSFVVYGASQPIVGKMIDKFGVRKIVSISTLIVGISIFLMHFAKSPRQLFMLFGIVASIGFGGLSNVATTVVITNWFNAKRGLAFGIMEAGSGAGQMLIVPLCLFSIERFGWERTVTYLGIFLIFIIFPILLLFLRNYPSDLGLQALGDGSINASKEIDKSDSEIKVSFWTIIKLRQFWFLIIPFFICGITTTGLMDTHLIPFSHDHGFSVSVTGVAVSLLAGFNIIGILLSGILSDRLDNRAILSFLYGTRALSLLILVYSHASYILFIFAILFGLVDFATVAPTQLLSTRYFKDYSVGFILGWVFLSHQIGSALGSYIPGLLYDLSGGYQLSFCIAIILCILASILCILLPKPIDSK